MIRLCRRWPSREELKSRFGSARKRDFLDIHGACQGKRLIRRFRTSRRFPKASPEAHARREPSRPAETAQRSDNRSPRGSKGARRRCCRYTRTRGDDGDPLAPSKRKRSSRVYPHSRNPTPRRRPAADYVASIITAMGIDGARVSSFADGREHCSKIDRRFRRRGHRPPGETLERHDVSGRSFHKQAAGRLYAGYHRQRQLP